MSKTSAVVGGIYPATWNVRSADSRTGCQQEPSAEDIHGMGKERELAAIRTDGAAVGSTVADRSTKFYKRLVGAPAFR